MRRLSKVEIAKMTDLYRNGQSINKISNSFSIDRSTIRYWLSKYSLLRPKTKLKLDASYFENLNNKNKCYWIGFLLADGTIGYRYLDTKNGKVRRPKRVNLTLQSKDESHLKLFKDEINFDGSIKQLTRFDKRYGKTRHHSSLTIVSVPFCNCLLAKGWDEFKKDGDISILERIPSHLLLFTMRGLFDGDGGSIVDKRNQIMVYFTNKHLSVVRFFQNWLTQKCGLNKTNIFQNSKSKLCRLQYRGNTQGTSILTYLYSGGGPMLRRKDARLVLDVDFSDI
jgi:hypothetical protein